MPAECYLDVEEGVTPLLGEEELELCCEAALEHEGVTRDCMVSVSYVSEARMRELNARWRDVDAPTDVLSLECERPDDPDLAPDEPCELGDIVLAPDYVARQAASFGTTPADEERLLVVHGMLHLLGYDHLDEAAAEEMEDLEMEVLGRVATDGTLTRVVLTRHREEGDA